MIIIGNDLNSLIDLEFVGKKWRELMLVVHGGGIFKNNVYCIINFILYYIIIRLGCEVYSHELRAWPTCQFNSSTV